MVYLRDDLRRNGRAVGKRGKEGQEATQGKDEQTTTVDNWGSVPTGCPGALYGTSLRVIPSEKEARL